MSSSAAQLAQAFDAALDHLAESDPAELSDLALVRRVEAMHRRVARLQALVLRDIAAIHRRGAAVADGFASTQALLRRRLRIDARAAARQVAVASTVDQLPETAAALAGGDISSEHAAAICQARRDLGADVMAGGGETLLLDEARTETPARVLRLARLLRDRLDPQGADERAARQFRDRWLDVARTWRGMVSVQGMLDPATGELVMAALAAYTPPPDAVDDTAGAGAAGTGAAGTGSAGTSEAVRTPGQRRADGFADLCQAALACADTTSASQPRPQVTVTVSLETLRGQHPATPATATLAGGQGPVPTSPVPTSLGPTSPVPTSPVPTGPVPTGNAGPAVLGAAGEPISPRTARRLACDAGVIPILLGTRGEPLDVGRQTRTIPTGIRRALELRDQGCRFPGCDRPTGRTHAHHIHHWARQGPTCLTNLVLLCTFHHWLVHEGRWTLHYQHQTNTLLAYRPGGSRYDLASGPDSRGPAP